MGFFFFFKQKTAYEMRIRDWSSACSSDLKRSRDIWPNNAPAATLARAISIFMARPSATGVHQVHQRTRGIVMPVTTVPGNTLITATPEEGRQLAIKMARLVIKATQPDDAVRDKLRPSYANDAAMLIQKIGRAHV